MRLIVAHPSALRKARMHSGYWACIDDSPGDFDRTKSALPAASVLIGPREVQEHFWQYRGAVVA